MTPAARWAGYMESYGRLYEMFSVNRQYRGRGFASEAEYLEVQGRLAEEIGALDREVGAEVREVIRAAFPDLEVLRYDSRMCSPARQVLGRVLVEGAPTAARALEAELWFERATGHRVHVDRVEDLPEGCAEEILGERAQ